jgi:4,5:9,10-diseco-3-hydroxy-5,9,17-trioxoandrosta-1(10),2-diene-4-oate hydrolase
MSAPETKPAERSVTVDGLRIRYLELGEGPPVLFLHGGSLGSSADVFLGNMPPLAAAGFRTLAYDQPGFGLSDTPTDHSAGYRRDSIVKFLDALGIEQAALIGHSQAGRPAVQVAFKAPHRISHVMVLGTGSLLPPAPDGGAGKTEGAAQQRLERRMATSEPTLEDTRKLLEANLYHTELITPEALALRHSRSIGPAFAAFQTRSGLAEGGGKKATATEETPIWRRLAELPVPLLLVFGREDRAKAFERATALKDAYPQLDLHIADGCKHLVPWDAADLVQRLAVPFLRSST